jgi:hypothetical protein
MTSCRKGRLTGRAVASLPRAFTGSSREISAALGGTPLTLAHRRNVKAWRRAPNGGTIGRSRTSHV